MSKKIVFANQKGGVGKTTTAVNIGSYMALSGKKVLLVDFDPQGNMTSSFGVEKGISGVYDALVKKKSPENVITNTKIDNLYLIPSDIHLTGAEIELVDKENRAFYLKKMLNLIEDKFDYILIDCPPSLGLLTLNGLSAADSVIVPLQCEYFALEGLKLLLQTIQQVQKTFNKPLQIGGIIFTMYDSRTNLSNEVVQNVTSYFTDKVFKTVIPRNIKLSEAPSHGMTISEYDKSCTGALSYKKLTEEVLKRV